MQSAWALRKKTPTTTKYNHTKTTRDEQSSFFHAVKEVREIAQTKYEMYIAVNRQML